MSFDSEFVLRALSIVAIDLTVAGDNALVIALAVRNLPAHQRPQARIWGTVGAVALRLLALIVVAWLLNIPFLQLGGGALLIWIAVRLVRQPGESPAHTREAATLGQAIWLIMVADAVMSLDNVLAVAAAARGDVALALLGVGLSMPIVVWGSGLVARLLTRYGWTLWLAGGILGYVAGEMIVEDPAFNRLVSDALLVDYLTPIAVALIVTAAGWFFSRAGVTAPRQSPPATSESERGSTPRPRVNTAGAGRSTCRGRPFGSASP